MKTYIGIDPGKSGAIAMVSAGMNDGIPQVAMLGLVGKGKHSELDISNISIIINVCESPIVMLEKVGAMPTDGRASLASFMTAFGELRGMLKTLGVPYQLITPQAWKKKVLEGLAWKGNKAASIQYCNAKYPDVRLSHSDRCTVQNHNMADALCLAEYGRMTNA